MRHLQASLRHIEGVSLPTIERNIKGATKTIVDHGKVNDIIQEVAAQEGKGAYSKDDIRYHIQKQLIKGYNKKVTSSEMIAERKKDPELSTIKRPVPSQESTAQSSATDETKNAPITSNNDAVQTKIEEPQTKIEQEKPVPSNPALDDEEEEEERKLAQTANKMGFGKRIRNFAHNHPTATKVGAGVLGATALGGVILSCFDGGEKQNSELYNPYQQGY